MLVLILFMQILGSLSIDPRTVQLNLETSFLIRRNDVNKRNSVINGLKSLLAGLDKHFKANNPEQPMFRSEGVGELTTFFTNLGQLMVKQDDKYLRNFTKVFIKVLEDYHKRSKFNIMFDDEGVKNYVLDNNLNNWIYFPPSLIRANIQYALDTDDTIFHKLVQFADRFFNVTDREPLAEIARDLAGGNEKRKDVAKIIKGAFNFILFQKIHGFSGEQKNLLRKELRKLVYGYNKLDFNDDREFNSDMKIKVDGKGKPAKRKPRPTKIDDKKQKTTPPYEVSEISKEEENHSKMNETEQHDDEESLEIIERVRGETETHSEVNEKPKIENKKRENDKALPPETLEYEEDLHVGVDRAEEDKDYTHEVNEKALPIELLEEKTEDINKESIKADGESLVEAMEKEVRRMNLR